MKFLFVKLLLDLEFFLFGLQCDCYMEMLNNVKLNKVVLEEIDEVVGVDNL